ncbi:hypothetical protein DFH09DRAFT_368955 [Mycena vulgaris]|nr:hypothetical protein DFH09DRAFT_368955 [Mycena vulgaris]
MLAGVGGGRILTLTAIIITDLVPLAERGNYQGLIGGVWCLASFMEPPIRGSQSGQRGPIHHPILNPILVRIDGKNRMRIGAALTDPILASILRSLLGSLLGDQKRYFKNRHRF